MCKPFVALHNRANLRIESPEIFQKDNFQNEANKLLEEMRAVSDRTDKKATVLAVKAAKFTIKHSSRTDDILDEIHEEIARLRPQAETIPDELRTKVSEVVQQAILEAQT